MNRKMQILRNKLEKLTNRVKAKKGCIVYTMRNGKAYTLPEGKLLGEGDKWKQEKLESENIEGFLEIVFIGKR